MASFRFYDLGIRAFRCYSGPEKEFLFRVSGFWGLRFGGLRVLRV